MTRGTDEPRATRGAQAETPGGTIARTGETDATGEPVVELSPPPRVTGPGRKEREYQERIAALEECSAEWSAHLARARQELELSGIVERGSQRLIDRVERQLAERRAELDTVRAQNHRMMVTLGAVQKENEQLHRELESARTNTRHLAAPRRRSPWWRRLGSRS